MEESLGGGLHTKTDKEYQEAERYKNESSDSKERCRLKMEAHSESAQ